MTVKPAGVRCLAVPAHCLRSLSLGVVHRSHSFLAGSASISTILPVGGLVRGIAPFADGWLGLAGCGAVIGTVGTAREGSVLGVGVSRGSSRGSVFVGLANVAKSVCKRSCVCVCECCGWSKSIESRSQLSTRFFLSLTDKGHTTNTWNSSS